jgi:hypothetical protein
MKAKKYTEKEYEVPPAGDVKIKLLSITEQKQSSTVYGDRMAYKWLFEVTHYREGNKFVKVPTQQISVFTGQEYGHENAKFTQLVKTLIPGLATKWEKVLDCETDFFTDKNKPFTGTGEISHSTSEAGREYARLENIVPSQEFLDYARKVLSDPFADEEDEENVFGKDN